MNEALIILSAIAVVAALQVAHLLRQARPRRVPQSLRQRVQLTETQDKRAPVAAPVEPAVAAGGATLGTRVGETTSETGVAPSPPLAVPPAQPAAGILYLDPTGRCVRAEIGGFAAPRSTALASHLSALLGGGRAEAADVMRALADTGKLPRYVTCLAGVATVALSGLVLRDRDANIWGAALFIEPLNGAEEPTSRRIASR